MRDADLLQPARCMPLGCHDKDRLENDYRIAVAEYDRVRQVMKERKGISSEAGYWHLCYDVEEALDRCKFIQNKIRLHQKEHGC